jgi:hypothetical protein
MTRARRRCAPLELGLGLALAASASCLPASDLDAYRNGHGSAAAGQGPASSAPAALGDGLSHLDGNLPATDLPVQNVRLAPESAGTTPPKAGLVDAGSALAGDGAAPDCSGGGELLDAARGRCYEFSAVAATWFVARAECIKRGGTLVTVDAQAENAALSAELVADAWIGASDRVSEGSFGWDDGTPFSFENFRPGEPDNLFGIQDCTLMHVTDGLWSDRDCRDVERYICERPLAR